MGQLRLAVDYLIMQLPSIRRFSLQLQALLMPPRSSSQSSFPATFYLLRLCRRRRSKYCLARRRQVLDEPNQMHHRRTVRHCSMLRKVSIKHPLEPRSRRAFPWPTNLGIRRATRPRPHLYPVAVSYLQNLI